MRLLAVISWNSSPRGLIRNRVSSAGQHQAVVIADLLVHAEPRVHAKHRREIAAQLPFEILRRPHLSQRGHANPFSTAIAAARLTRQLPPWKEPSSSASSGGGGENLGELRPKGGLARRETPFKQGRADGKGVDAEGGQLGDLIGR